MKRKVALVVLYAMLPVVASAANLYEYRGYIEPLPGTANPWGLPGDGSALTLDGAPFELHVVVDAAAADRDCCSPHYASFDPANAVLLIGGVRAALSYVAPGAVWVAFTDDAGTGAFDQLSFRADAELQGVRQPLYFSVRLPPGTFALNGAPGAILPPLFEDTQPSHLGAADNDAYITYPDHHPVTATLDSDADAVADTADNCLEQPNDDQRDTDGDGIGNACDGDFNGDCQQNFADLSTMKAQLFVVGDLDTDMNGDGITNFSDLSLLKQGFFQPPGPSGIPNLCAL